MLQNHSYISSTLHLRSWFQKKKSMPMSKCLFHKSMSSTETKPEKTTTTINNPWFFFHGIPLGLGFVAFLRHRNGATTHGAADALRPGGGHRLEVGRWTKVYGAGECGMLLYLGRCWRQDLQVVYFRLVLVLEFCFVLFVCVDILGVDLLDLESFGFSLMKNRSIWWV